jgi:hypothetical protein
VRSLGNESADIHRHWRQRDHAAVPASSASGRTLLAKDIELIDRGALGPASDQRGM